MIEFLVITAAIMSFMYLYHKEDKATALFVWFIYGILTAPTVGTVVGFVVLLTVILAIWVHDSNKNSLQVEGDAGQG